MAGADWIVTGNLTESFEDYNQLKIKLKTLINEIKNKSGITMSYKPTIKSKNFHNFKKLPSMENKTILITGTTTGTGFVAAQTVAELGQLIMLNRPSKDRKPPKVKL